jgi:lipoprotein-anchoring transpeptidase ErfK/SrfK
VRLRYDEFRLEVSLGRHRLLLWRGPRLVDRQRIGVGRVVTPTPHGLYYIIQEFRLTDPGGPFGPYALGLSAYSDVLQTFGSGPGQIAIHGTNDPGGIGADVSHGCIHVNNPEIIRLARLLPLGTPVTITA